MAETKNGKMQIMHGNEVVLDAPVYYIDYGKLFFIRAPNGNHSKVFVSDRDMHRLNYDPEDVDNKGKLPELVFPCFFKTKKAIYFSNGIGGLDKLCDVK